ncbi:YdbL family protein [Neptunomonas sp. XY-337]|uniref:YdbL family protein n=1 Tax=Neptunomonas sp. XY-337 TaxID=2561897 RepID=UPI0010A9CCFA|nr:YdbL family protein [Neptunomonas sp. XY-337]
MPRTIKQILLTMVLSTLFTNAWALSLDEAKAKGLVGETQQGYLASVTASPSGDVRALIDSINKKRATAYQQSASKAGVERSVIEARIAQRLYERAGSGSYLKSPAGQWYRKP